MAGSRLEPEGSLLEGRWPQDKGEVDPPSLHKSTFKVHTDARAAL